MKITEEYLRDDISDELLEKLLDTAHDRGQTLHEFVIEILTEAMLPNKDL